MLSSAARRARAGRQRASARGGDGAANRVALATHLVRDDGEALAFFAGALGFVVFADLYGGS